VLDFLAIRRWLSCWGSEIVLVVASLLASGLLFAGLGASALVLLLLVCIASLPVAWMVLERDVVQFAFGGGLLGVLMGVLTSGGNVYAITEGGLAGLLTGALWGDALRDVRTLVLTRAVQRLPSAWPRQPRLESWWWIKAVRGITGLALVIVVPWMLIQIGQFTCKVGQPDLFHQIAVDCHAAAGELPSFAATLAFSLLRFWYIYALLGLALAAGMQQRKGAASDNALIIDRRLRRVAIVSSLVLLLLSTHAMIVVLLAPANSGSFVLAWPPTEKQQCQALVTLFYELPLPVFLTGIAVLLTGDRLYRYRSPYGWILAIGVLGSFAVTLAIVFIVVAQRCIV